MLKHKRSKGLTFLLFPALIIAFVVGWCMYLMGDDKRTMNARVKAVAASNVQEDNVTILAIPIEEKQEIMGS
jgi:hypothetical protein